MVINIYKAIGYDFIVFSCALACLIMHALIESNKAAFDTKSELWFGA